MIRHILAAVVASLLFCGAALAEPPRSPKCGEKFRAERQPFFGDLHVHTAYSTDAFVFDVANGPRDAYVFARGGEVKLSPVDLDRNPTRPWKLLRPLDFAAVTDHAEGFGMTKVCSRKPVADPPPEEIVAYNSPECQLFRGVVPSRDIPLPQDTQLTLHARLSRTTLLLLIADVGLIPPTAGPTCDLFPDQCDAGVVTLWNETREAAAAFNDPCDFTTFVAYEWTAMPGTANLHRNVIFRNDHVPGKPISYLDTQVFDAKVLWRMLDEACLHPDPQTGPEDCDVLTIPHNSNLSAGLMFPDPADAREASDRAVWEPLVEITQHKGASECRFDRLYGAGVDTTDELCSFEQVPGLTLFPIPGPSTSPPPQLFPRRSFIRNVLKDGLKLEQQGFDDPTAPGGKRHVNPFKLGIIGSTDTHNGTPGNTEESRWPGHGGNQEDSPLKQMSDGGTARANPGGLAVVWAEENTRDSIFDALRRRETYGTSGTRPVVRFFGGWSYADDLCSKPNLVKVGYKDGVPMGSDLKPRPKKIGGNPKFVVWGTKDPGVAEGGSLVPGTGTPLQRIQIIKGWVEPDGTPREEVYDVVGSPPSEQVDMNTCTATQAGSSELCTVWEDEKFDATRPAFYYARVLEDPTCRWSTYACRDEKLLGPDFDPYADDCPVQAATKVPGSNLLDCCAFRISPVVQERAWTSPIWYRPSS